MTPLPPRPPRLARQRGAAESLAVRLGRAAPRIDLDEVRAQVTGLPEDPAAAAIIRLQALAGGLGAVPLGPRREFREALRARLVAAASARWGDGATGTVAPPGTPDAAAVRDRPSDDAHRSSWASSRALIAGLSLSVAAGGVAAAGSRALPGDPFYPVKRSVESVQLQLSGGDRAQAERHLQFAASRLRETAALAVDPEQAAERVGDIVTALRDLRSEVAEAAALLEAVAARDQVDEPLDVLADAAVRHRRELDALLPALPASAQAAAQETLTVLEQAATGPDRLAGP